MALIELLQTSPFLLGVLSAILGLVVGSFLNVVIHRLPIMMEREWASQCRELLAGDDAAAAAPTGTDVPPDAGAEDSAFSLVGPGSHCPHCGHSITAMENIPLIGYLRLKGRCSACGERIALRYPLVEALTGVLSVVVVWHFGFTVQAGAALCFTWALIALSFIDFDRQLLPDSMTLPFLWLGLTLNLFGVFTDLRSAVIGAIAGYLVLWSVYKLFKLITGKEGMGYGDFKLLAVLGAWMGWQSLPMIVILSSVVGALVGIGTIAVAGRDKNLPIPFGPYLAVAGWITLLWGSVLAQAYLRWSGLG